MLCSVMLLGTVSASADTERDTLLRKLSYMPEGYTTYFKVTFSTRIPIYNFISWLEENRLPDTSLYTPEMDEELAQDYISYVEQKRGERKQRGIDFFEENFDASIDEFVYASENRGLQNP